MKHALERYNDMVTVQLKSMSTPDEKSNELKLSEWIDRSETEKENIRHYLLKKSLKIKTESEFELLIQQYQAEIIQLLDIAFNGIFNNPSKQHRKLFDVILKDLGEILTHIENRYSKYFNVDEKVPTTYLMVTQVDLERRVSKLREFCNSALGNNELIKTVFNPLDAFFELEEKVSFRQLKYAKDLVSEMEAWANEKEESPSLRGFLTKLVYMNFNAINVGSFFMWEIANAINAIPTRNQKIERLADYLKQCNQTHIKPGVSFRPNLFPLKEQISSWIAEEISYLEKSQTLLSVVPGYVDEVIADEEKIHLGLSVEVLSILVRAAKDCKLILNKQMRNLFRTVSKFVRTWNVDTPSPNSLFNKSYEADRNAKSAAIDLLHEMINQIRKY